MLFILQTLKIAAILIVNHIIEILITEYNKFYTNRQILYIQNTLDLILKINNNTIFNEKLFLKEIYNNNKKYVIKWCENYNINMK